ncbi:MAG: hypothetical protein OHK0053_36180 [Microscillaceae bacterium]
MALAHNPDKKVYLLRISQAKQEHKTSKSYLYPSLSTAFSGQNNLQIPLTPVPGVLFGSTEDFVFTKFGAQFAYNAGFQMNYSLFDWQQKTQSNLAKQQIALKEAEMFAFQQTLMEQVAQSYYAALLAQNSLEISRRDLLLADSLVLFATQKLSEGLIDALALNQSKINRQTIQESILQSQNLLQESHENLKLMLGLSLQDSLMLTEEIADLISYEGIDLGGYKDRTLDVYKAQTLLSELEIKNAKSNYFPKVSLSSSLLIQQFRNDFGISFSGDDWQPNQFIALNFNLPITNRARGGEYKNSLIKKQISELSYQSEARKSETENQELLRNFSYNYDLADNKKTMFDLYSQNLALTKQKYEQGLTSMESYLKVFEDYLRAENAYMSQMLNLLTARAFIKARR